MTSKLEEALNIAYSCYKDKGNIIYFLIGRYNEWSWGEKYAGL